MELTELQGLPRTATLRYTLFHFGHSVSNRVCFRGGCASRGRWTQFALHRLERAREYRIVSFMTLSPLLSADFMSLLLHVVAGRIVVGRESEMFSRCDVGIERWVGVLVFLFAEPRRL